MVDQKRFFSVAAFAASCAMLASSALAQTCRAGIEASNPTSAYVINTSIGTVIDTRTGLMWDRCPLGRSGVNCLGGSTTVFTWQQALNAAATIGTYKGYSDWRLPNIKELQSLVEECRIDPSINEYAFPTTPTSIGFWSSTPLPGSDAAYDVIFFYGNVIPLFSRDGTAADAVRLVRAAQ